ncbi:MAG: sulfotransferase, partial [Bacteroidetes bacterium]|nr:sulfotransferase [Bacteroidota bacterium]
WKQEQVTFIDAVTIRGLNCISIRYEDLIENPQSTMTKVLEYIDVDIDAKCFQTNEDNQESKTNPYWENLSKPVMANNKNKFKTQLQEDDIRMIETITKNEMQFFGYEFTTNADWVPTEEYTIGINNERERVRKGIIQKSSDTINQLNDKANFMNEIVSQRKKSWTDKYFVEYNLLPVSKKNKSFLKNRVKFLSYTFLGQNLTKRVSSILRFIKH